MRSKIVIWFVPHENSYYYKIVKGTYIDYYVGYVNRYKHVVVLLIPFDYDFFHKPPLIKRVLKKLISFLQKIEKRL